MASLSLRHLSKTYDNGVNAIRDFTLEVDDKNLWYLPVRWDAAFLRY